MKGKRRLIGAIFACLLTAATLFGCVRVEPYEKPNTFGNTKDSFYLYKDLAVMDVLIEPFEAAKYDIEEYKGFLKQEIGEYNAAHSYTPKPAEEGTSASPDEPKYSESITLFRCEVDNDLLYQSLLYATAADYNTFPDNQIRLQRKSGAGLVTGTLADAPELLAKTDYVTPNGTKLDIASIISSQKASEYRYMLADFNCFMYGDGDVIAYASGMEWSAENACAGLGKARYAIMIFHDPR